MRAPSAGRRRELRVGRRRTTPRGWAHSGASGALRAKKLFISNKEFFDMQAVAQFSSCGAVVLRPVTWPVHAIILVPAHAPISGQCGVVVQAVAQFPPAVAQSC